MKELDPKDASFLTLAVQFEHLELPLKDRRIILNSVKSPWARQIIRHFMGQKVTLSKEQQRAVTGLRKWLSSCRKMRMR